jgi:hypothetical protein
MAGRLWGLAIFMTLSVFGIEAPVQPAFGRLVPLNFVGDGVTGRKSK